MAPLNRHLIFFANGRSLYRVECRIRKYGDEPGIALIGWGARCTLVDIGSNFQHVPSLQIFVDGGQPKANIAGERFDKVGRK